MREIPEVWNVTTSPVRLSWHEMHSYLDCYYIWLHRRRQTKTLLRTPSQPIRLSRELMWSFEAATACHVLVSSLEHPQEIAKLVVGCDGDIRLA